MQVDEEPTLKKLEIFLAFRRSGNLSRAAAELDTRTVSVHRAIHSLESAHVLENRVRLIPLQARYRLQQQIGVVFLKSRERDPNLLALTAECRMYAKRHAG